MQLAKEQGNEEFRVVVLEKGGEVGKWYTVYSVYSSLLNLFSRRPYPLWSSNRTKSSRRAYTRLEGKGSTAQSARNERYDALPDIYRKHTIATSPSNE